MRLNALRCNAQALFQDGSASRVDCALWLRRGNAKRNRGYWIVGWRKQTAFLTEISRLDSGDGHWPLPIAMVTKSVERRPQSSFGSTRASLTREESPPASTIDLRTETEFLPVQPLGSIFRNSFAIYGGNWRTISLIYALPMLPIALLHAVLLGIQPRGLANIVSLIFASIGLLTGAVVTVMISDRCLGLQPSVWRSYRRGFANIGRLIGTYFLGVLFISLLGAAGTLLLIVPGLILRSGMMLSAWFLIGGTLLLLIPILILTVWYMFFIVAVVVLEKLGGRAALRRSRALGKGSYLRNIGILFLVLLPPSAAV
jgi:hypothetical protein